MFINIIYDFSDNRINKASDKGNYELSAYLKSEFLKTVIPNLYR